MNDYLKRFQRVIQPHVGLDNQSNRETFLKFALLSLPEGSRILDAGAGTQQYRRFCQHLNYVSQDFGKYAGKGDQKGLGPNTFDYGRLDIICDITTVPEPNCSFDAIMCIEVLEHLTRPDLALKEFARLLKPGGKLILTAPFCSLTHFAPYHFYTGFNRYYYENHLTNNGFSILEITPNGNYFEYLGQEAYRLARISREYTTSHVGLLGHLAIIFFARILLRLSKSDIGSAELLCYGYHIMATKEDSAGAFAPNGKNMQ